MHQSAIGRVLFVSIACCLGVMGCQTSMKLPFASKKEPAEDREIKQVSHTKPARQRAPGPVDDDAPEEFTKTSSGLKYRIRRRGDGLKPTPSESVRVHYRGWLDNGKVFDESYRLGKPIEFKLSQVVKGWGEGLQYVKEGGMIELEVPSHLGYGPSGMGDIPPNATLHFLVELLEVL